jgi:hypothetical protein
MNTRYKIVLFVICLVALFALQSKVVFPWVLKVVASDLFLEDSGDPGSQTPVSTEMTRFAFQQCNSYISNDLGSKYSVTFPTEPINSWAVGNYEYMINADIQITPEGSAPVTKRYACNIKYDNKGDKTGIENADNWSVRGLSGLSGV